MLFLYGYGIVLASIFDRKQRERKETMGHMTKQANGWALLPILFFLVVYLGGGILFRDFYSMPAIVVFLLALLVAFLQNRRLSFAAKMHLIAEGLADDNIITMCLIFLTAGAFTGAVSAAGGVDSTVNLGLTLLPGGWAVVGLFFIGCFISISMGTSVGTISALAPIAIGISEKTGFGTALCLGAVISGAMFGDNLSMISDTTIAATKTQGCEMKDKFRMNFLMVLPAALVTMVLLFVSTMGADYTLDAGLSYNFFQGIPYLVVLVGALLGFNVFLVLAVGTALSLVVGCATGAMPVSAIFSSMGTGVSAMYDITVISIIVSCISTLMAEGGGIQAILDFIGRRVHSKRGAALGIAALAAGVDVATANNTVAIVVTGGIAKNISEEYGLEPRETASLLDIFTSVVQGLLPYGAQLLYAAAATATASTVLTSFEILPFCFYPMLMAVGGLLYILVSPRMRKSKA